MAAIVLVGMATARLSGAPSKAIRKVAVKATFSDKARRQLRFGRLVTTEQGAIWLELTLQPRGCDVGFPPDGYNFLVQFESAALERGHMAAWNTPTTSMATKKVTVQARKDAGRLTGVVTAQGPEGSAAVGTFEVPVCDLPVK